MVDAEKLAAFVVVTGTTSLIPGPSMLFVMGQAIWRGAGSGAAALAGLQFGYIVWWLLAALGLGALAAAFPLAFRLLGIGGALYLAWMGVQALRTAGEAAEDDARPRRGVAASPFWSGIFVAIGNPKALIYIVALLPPFIDAQSPIVPQLVLFAIVAMAIDLALGTIYILAGSRMARAMTRPRTRQWLKRGVGAIYLVVAAAILTDLLTRARL